MAGHLSIVQCRPSLSSARGGLREPDQSLVVSQNLTTMKAGVMDIFI